MNVKKPIVSLLKKQINMENITYSIIATPQERTEAELRLLLIDAQHEQEEAYKEEMLRMFQEQQRYDCMELLDQDREPCIQEDSPFVCMTGVTAHVYDHHELPKEWTYQMEYDHIDKRVHQTDNGRAIDVCVLIGLLPYYIYKVQRYHGASIFHVQHKNNSITDFPLHVRYEIINEHGDAEACVYDHNYQCFKDKEWLQACNEADRLFDIINASHHGALTMLHRGGKTVREIADDLPF